MSGEEELFWENQTWDCLTNSDKSGGSGDYSGKKCSLPLGSSSNSPTELGKKVATISKKRVQEESHRNGKAIASESKEAKVGGGGGGSGGGESDHEMHIWTERERRKKMRNMFSSLHALLPQLPPKADKSTIVDEAVNYIKTLQQTLQRLQKQKLERLQGATATFGYSPSLTTSQNQSDSREAFLADLGSTNNMPITATKPANLNASSILRYPVMFQTWTSTNVVLNICGDEAQISICSPKKPGLFSTICYLLEKHNIQVMSAHVSSDCTRSMYMIQARANGAYDRFTETIPAEETYKQAAAEIMCWVTT
ncbi:hypothetical protein K2173_001129 [Erythroxylum novogranatense]|uniref:BHLH domain-containing protein n=1 Tax=Erythroxylum novogranatense TaxID=1862640 RepID=A0AAV8TKF7_9ROSI|nr:hypothetical protein K2173_001129 [Erythroxylum novogranatense]